MVKALWCCGAQGMWPRGADYAHLIVLRGVQRCWVYDIAATHSWPQVGGSCQGRKHVCSPKTLDIFGVHFLSEPVAVTKASIDQLEFLLASARDEADQCQTCVFIVFSGEPPSSHPLLPPNPLYLDVETHSTGVIPSSPSNPLCPTHSREPPNSLFHPSHSATSYITPSRSFDLAHRSLSHLVWIYWLRSSPA